MVHFTKQYAILFQAEACLCIKPTFLVEIIFKDDLPQGFVALGYCTIEKTDKFPTRPFCFEIVNTQWNDEKDFAIQASTDAEREVGYEKLAVLFNRNGWLQYVQPK